MPIDHDIRSSLEKLYQLSPNYLAASLYGEYMGLNSLLDKLSTTETLPPPDSGSLVIHEGEGCVVRGWQIVNAISDKAPLPMLYGTVVDDRYGRFAQGDYVYTSAIQELDEEIGLVKTKNSFYILQGHGVRINVTQQEAYLMRTSGHSAQELRTLYLIKKEKEWEVSFEKS